MQLTEAYLRRNINTDMLEYRDNFAEDIRDARLIDDYTPNETGIVYVADINNQNAYSIREPLLLTDADSTALALAQLKQLIRSNQKFDNKVSALLEKAGEYSAAEMLHQVSLLLGHPVLLLNESHMITAKYPAHGLILPSKEQIKEYMDKPHPNILKDEGLFSCPHILFSLGEMKNVSGHIIVLLDKSDAMLTEQHIRRVSKLLGAHLLLCEQSYLSEGEEFIHDVLDGRLIDSLVIRQGLSHLGIKNANKVYLLSVKDEYEKGNLAYKLREILNRNVYNYGEYCIAFFNYSAVDSFTDASYPELMSFLSKNHLCAGLSNAFFDLSGIKNAFAQSIAAVSLHHHYRPQACIAHYSGVFVSHLLQIAASQGADLLSLCSPIVLHIMDFDKQNGTFYLETLYAYISNNLSIQKTADVLFLHRNTAYLRIKYLKDYFKIDFEDFRTLFKLHNSFMIMCYLRIVDPDSTQRVMGPLV